jgi:hypothetical protein
VNRGEDTAGICEEDGVAVMVDNGGCPGGSVGVSAGVLVSGKEVVSETQPAVSTMKTIPIRIAGKYPFLVIFSIVLHSPLSQAVHTGKKRRLNSSVREVTFPLVLPEV